MDSIQVASSPAEIPAASASPAENTPAPISRAERITSLDSLRGFALLGILLMNIVAMGMYGNAYDDPTAAGGSTGANLGVWAVLHVIAEGKMRAIFSLVFGAGIILLTSRLEATGRSSADVFYRRTGWLLLFGIVHAYLFWLGDILYPYALCALILYPFRKMSARGLIITGSIILTLMAGAYIGEGFGTRSSLREGRAAVAASQRGEKLTEKQEDAKRAYEQREKRRHPDAAALKKDADEWRGNFFSVVGARGRLVGEFHSEPYYGPGNWDVWCMMLIGMGLMKLGILSAERSTKYYATMVLIGYGIGLPLNSYTAWLIIKSNFDPVQHAFANSTYDLGRLTVALGHIGLIMLLAKTGAVQWLMNALGAVGQTAFSNYILTSIITAFYFTGYGFKMYGRLERYQLYYVVAAIWIFNLVASSIWVRNFRFGPLEWCWRSLTYWKRQPMRLTAPEPVLTPAVAVASGD
jgi:uncharacterized protein